MELSTVRQILKTVKNVERDINCFRINASMILKDAKNPGMKMDCVRSANKAMYIQDSNVCRRKSKSHAATYITLKENVKAVRMVLTSFRINVYCLKK